MRSVLRLVVFVRGEEQAYLRIGSALFQGHGALRGGAPTEDMQGATSELMVAPNGLSTFA